MQNGDFWTRTTSLYGSQPSPVALWMQNNVSSSRVTSLCSPSPPLWFLDAKQRLLDQNSKSLWVPALTCDFCMQNSDFWTRITSLYGCQTSPVALCLFNCVLSLRNTSLYASPSLSVDFECKTASFGTELYVSMGPRPHLVLYGCKTT